MIPAGESGVVVGVDPRSPANRGWDPHPRSPANRGWGRGWGSGVPCPRHGGRVPQIAWPEANLNGRPRMMMLHGTLRRRVPGHSVDTPLRIFPNTRRSRRIPNTIARDDRSDSGVQRRVYAPEILVVATRAKRCFTARGATCSARTEWLPTAAFADAPATLRTVRPVTPR